MRYVYYPYYEFDFLYIVGCVNNFKTWTEKELAFVGGSWQCINFDDYKYTQPPWNVFPPVFPGLNPPVFLHLTNLVDGFPYRGCPLDLRGFRCF